MNYSKINLACKESRVLIRLLHLICIEIMESKAILFSEHLDYYTYCWNKWIQITMIYPECFMTTWMSSACEPCNWDNGVEYQRVVNIYSPKRQGHRWYLKTVILHFSGLMYDPSVMSDSVPSPSPIGDLLNTVLDAIPSFRDLFSLTG